METNVDMVALTNTLNAMAQHLSDLKGLVTTLQNNNQKKQEEIDELHAQVVSKLPAMTTMLVQALKELFISKKAKVPKPHDYNGDWLKLATFCQKAKTYIVDQGLDSEEETEKVINVIAGYLMGNAALWYATAYMMRLQNENLWSDRGKFWEEMKARFGDADPTFMARMKLSKLRQGGKTVQLYSSLFNKYAGLTGYNDKVFVNAYFKGLNDNILQGVFTQEKIPNTLEKAQAATTREEIVNFWLTNFVARKHWESGTTPPKKPMPANSVGPSGTKTTNTTHAPSTSMEARPSTSGPMEVD